MMKRIIICIFIWFLGSFAVYAQNANFLIQITVNDNGTIKDLVADYGITEADLSYEIANLRYENCVQTSRAVGYWGIQAIYSFIQIDLDVFSACGGWKTNDPIQFTMTVHKPGSPLDGCSGVCSFLGSAGGELEGEDAIVIMAKPVSTSLLEKSDFDSL